MPYCGSRDCDHCFPPNAEEYRALSDAIEAIECETPKGGECWESGDNQKNYTPNMSHHDDCFDPAFQMMASAYEAGMKNALRILRQELSKYE